LNEIDPLHDMFSSQGSPIAHSDSLDLQEPSGQRIMDKSHGITTAQASKLAEQLPSKHTTGRPGGQISGISLSQDVEGQSVLEATHNPSSHL
jgi:hypothetical protein